MANTVVKQSEVVGNVKSKTMLVEQIARWNSLNRTGKINYNEGGIGPKTYPKIVVRSLLILEIF